MSLDGINSIIWVASNLLVLYIGIALIVFVVGYYVLFDTKATTVGRFVFRFALSLIGVIALVYIGLFINPKAGQAWFTYSIDTVWWRPALRLIVYGYVAYSVTALAVLLGIRKWAPQRLRTALDRAIVKPRHDEVHENGS